MKTDLYTKIVLTVIAVCLTIMVFKQIDFVPTVNASPPELMLDPEVNYGLVPLNADGTIDVNIKTSSSTIEVDIEDISTSDELHVNIDEVGGSSVYGRIPVDLD